MRIIHTSDLHIGKRLYDIDLLKDQESYFIWLTDLIKKESVDALLISGDIFDVANPSSEARKLYYSFLIRLSKLNCKVIITGGNHDSPAVLDAPKEILKTLDIHVIGSMPENPEEMIIPLRKNNQPVAVVAAIPYLRDRDLRVMNEGESYTDRLESIREGITKVYELLSQLCKNKYPELPMLAMGHLFVKEGVVSESEREVQVGNQAGVDSAGFPASFDYYALGHLHKPQEIADRNLYYSGSPYPLSFSEKDNKPRVLMIQPEGKSIRVESIEVPSTRRLLKFSGTLEEVRNHLDEYAPADSPFDTLIELEIVEENYDPHLIEKLEKLEEEFKAENTHILKSRIRFLKRIGGTDELYSVEQDIDDLAPRDVFNRRLENEEMNDETKTLLMDAFDEILERVLSEE